MVRSKASKQVWRLQVEWSPPIPHTSCSGMQCCRHSDHALQGNRDDMLARPRGGASCHDHYTGGQNCGHLCCQAMRMGSGKQSKILHHEAVDRQISNRQSKNANTCSVFKQRLLESFLQLPQYRTKGGGQCCALHNWSCTLKLCSKWRGAAIWTESQLWHCVVICK